VRYIVLFVLSAATTCGLLIACGQTDQAAAGTIRAVERGADYGWFTYAAADGWSRYEPPPGITYDPELVEFRPDDEDPMKMDKSSRTWLNIHDVTDVKSRTERIPSLYARVQESIWRSRCDSAQAMGQPMPAFEQKTIASPIGGPDEHAGFSFLSERDGKKIRTLVFFVETPDGRYFRAYYRGLDPDFTKHRDAIVASLKSLEFTSPALPVPSREKTVAFFKAELDDEKLWLYDGEVEGRRLNDAHLAALTDPAFAGVEDLNLVSGPTAMMSGVEVTDAGLVHIKHLPLRSLCLRGSLVTDAGLAHLKDLPLKSLVLGGTLIEGDGLAHLAGLKLRAIDLENTAVGDEHLKHLAGLPLLSINLRNTQVTEAGLEALQKRLPEVLVSH
jgi:hypothetical protein